MNLLLILISVSSTKKTNICIDCKHFTQSYVSFNSQFGRCKLFPKIRENDNNYLVTGIKSAKLPEDYEYCSIVRGSYIYSEMCGPEGKLFEKKNTSNRWWL